jgi:hypothetical protein
VVIEFGRCGSIEAMRSAKGPGGYRWWALRVGGYSAFVEWSPEAIHRGSRGWSVEDGSLEVWAGPLYAVAGPERLPQQHQQADGGETLAA